MTDTELIEQLLKFLDLQDRDALVWWIDHAYFGYEYDVVGMIRDEDSQRLRLLTEEEKKKRYQESLEFRDRMERGEGSPYEVLMWKTMQSYMDELIDNVFTSRPLPFNLNKNDAHLDCDHRAGICSE